MVAAVVGNGWTTGASLGSVRSSPSLRLCLLFSGALLLLVIVLRWLVTQHPFPGDAWAAGVGASSKPWLVYAITRAYQQVGRPLVAVGEVLLMLGWLWRTEGRRVTQGLFVALAASATAGLIKTFCGPTPYWLALHHVGANFPSGVVTFVTAAGGYIGIAALQQGRRVAPALALVAIAGAGPARVLGGQHLISDVLAGYMLGVAWLVAACIYALATDERTNAEELYQAEAVWTVSSLETQASHAGYAISEPSQSRA